MLTIIKNLIMERGVKLEMHVLRNKKNIGLWLEIDATIRVNK